MPEPVPRSRKIRILRDEVSRKIAAGEVIDRPFSIVRELLDNALDAGASAIDVSLESGGLTRIRVVDDGAGMEEEDLALCWQAHATSKIETEDDLLRVESLGFRGEALSSIAECSRLVIVSSTDPDSPAWRLEAHGGRLVSMEKSTGRKGTVVEVSELFFNFPARKKFLRSPSAESALCRGVLLDRASAHPDVAFRLLAEEQVRMSLRPAPLSQRLAEAHDNLDARLLSEAGEEGEGFTVRVVTGSPDLRRRDRRLLQCFVNRRRVSEFALLQAAEFGFQGFMPGGWHPAAFVFVQIDPSLVDFNIHPAKKEVRFRNLPEVHRAVVAAVRKTLQHGASGDVGRSNPTVRPPMSGAGQSGRRASVGGGDLSPARRELSLPLSPDPAPSPGVATDSAIRFLGQVFGVFLIFELPGRLLMLDQHAAHERILYERLVSRPPDLQEMLFPICFDVTREEQRRLEGMADDLRAVGIGIRTAGPRAMEVTLLAADLKPLSEPALIELIRETGGEHWRQSLLATAACRLAIKEGDRVDAVTAARLCEQALALPVPRCPHGRPIWHELSRETLLKLVDRPVD